jgi:hypothetical protein
MVGEPGAGDIKAGRGLEANRTPPWRLSGLLRTRRCVATSRTVSTALPFRPASLYPCPHLVQVSSAGQLLL